MDKLNEIKLKDFYIAAMLRCLGFELIRIESFSNNIASFVFLDPEKVIPETISKYWDKEIIVKARDMIDAIHEIKSRLYSR